MCVWWNDVRRCNKHVESKLFLCWYRKQTDQPDWQKEVFKLTQVIFTLCTWDWYTYMLKYFRQSYCVFMHIPRRSISQRSNVLVLYNYQLKCWKYIGQRNNKQAQLKIDFFHVNPKKGRWMYSLSIIAGYLRHPTIVGLSIKQDL